MVSGFLQILLCQLIGEVIVAVTGVPLPGPVLGMLVLLAVLAWRRPLDDSPVVRACDGLLRHLGLLFVPAGVGVMGYTGLLQRAPVPVVGGLLLAWAATLLATAAAARGMLLFGRRDQASSHPGAGR